MNQNFRRKGEFLIYLKNYLIALNRENKQALLIIDECQHLNQKLLEEVRLLSNIEKTDTKLINIFFVGQSEFNNIILRPHNRAIRQRITINYDISALSLGETDAYIRFRLGVAGAEDKIFTSEAIQEVYRFSNGYPRLINIICDQALLTGFVKEKKHIDENIVAECAEELKIERGTSIEKSDATPEAQVVNGNRITPANSLRSAWLPMRTPLLIALIVVLIIWIGLIVAFLFTQQRSKATDNNAQQKQSSIDNQSSPAVADVTSETEPDHASLDKRPAVDDETRRATGGETPLPATSADQAQATTGIAVAANTIAADTIDLNGENEQQQSLASLSRPMATVAENEVSLDDIHEKYGKYPEVHFGNNSNNLDGNAYEILDEISRFCVQNPETIIILRGYTDKTGVRTYNVKLSEFRADTVKTYLVGRGVRPETITSIAIGPGEEGPGGTTVPFDEHRRKVVIEIVSPTG